MNRKLAIVDTETGGLNEKQHALIDAHVLLVEEFSWALVGEAGGRIWPEPGLTISQGAAAVNGWNSAVWRATSRPERDVLGAVIWLAVQADVWVGANPDFDVRFLRVACQRHGYDFAPRARIDVLRLGREAFGGSQSLAKLCARLGVTQADSHTARGDCFRTLEVMRQLWRRGRLEGSPEGAPSEGSL